MTPEEAFGNIVASLPDDFEDAGEIPLVYSTLSDRKVLYHSRLVEVLANMIYAESVQGDNGRENMLRKKEACQSGRDLLAEIEGLTL